MFQKPDNEDSITFVVIEIHFMVSLWKPWLLKLGFRLEQWGQNRPIHILTEGQV